MSNRFCSGWAYIDEPLDLFSMIVDDYEPETTTTEMFQLEPKPALLLLWQLPKLLLQSSYKLFSNKYIYKYIQQ
ncbi:MAG: hypothetical protein ACKPKO_37730, partial [Candidatus Fonsibacter sp.]